MIVIDFYDIEKFKEELRHEAGLYSSTAAYLYCHIDGVYRRNKTNIHPAITSTTGEIHLSFATFEEMERVYKFVYHVDTIDTSDIPNSDYDSKMNEFTNKVRTKYNELKKQIEVIENVQIHHGVIRTPKSKD